MSNQEINEKFRNDLYRNIRIEEGRNLRTGRYDDNTMRRYIEQEIRKVVKKEEENEI